MRKIKVSKLISWLYVLLFVYFIIGQCFGLTLNIYILILLALIGLFFTKRKMNNSNKKVLILLISFFIYGLITVFINHGGIGSIFSICSGIIVFLAFKNIKFSKFQLYCIVFAAIITNIYWVFNSNGYYDAFFINHWTGDGSLTNSNTVGKYICYTAMIIIALFPENRIKYKFFKVTIFVLSLYGIYNCRARISLMVLVLFVLIYILRKKIFKSNIFSRNYILIIIIILLFDTLFPFLYLKLYNIGFGTDIQTFGLSSKGLFSGREEIWINAVNGFDSIPKWFIGVGSNVNYWEGHVLNLHNISMNLLVTTGILGLLFYFGILIFVIKKNCTNINNNDISLKLGIFFICILFEGISDITIFYNTFLLYYFATLGIGCNISENIEINKRRKKNDINYNTNI